MALLLAAALGAQAQAAADGATDWVQLRLQARAAFDGRDLTAALAHYERLVALRPDDADVLIEAARVNGHADRNAEAAKLYRRALAAAPARRADIVPSLAWQALWGGTPAEAEQHFAELAALPGAGTAARADALDGLGQARQAQGDQAGALLAFREAHALAPQHLRLHRRLAMSLLWNGHEDEAAGMLQALLRQQPGDRDLAWALANAHNFSGLHRQAVAEFLGQTAPVHPGERADLARAWRWAGYEDKAWPLLADPTDKDAAWLRDWRVWRDLARFGYARVEHSKDRDPLVARAVVVGAGWHPTPGGTLDFQARRLWLDDPFGEPGGTQFQASYRWRLGDATSATGTFWPTLALRASHVEGWSTLLPSARLLWIPKDNWRVNAEATRELIETPKAVSKHVTVDVLAGSFEHRPATPWLLAAAAAVLRFDDGTTRVRVNGRVERTVVSRPRLVAGIEATAFERVADGLDDRGYWNPQRYAEARVYTTLTHEVHPFDFYLRLGLGVSHEVDGGGSTSGRPHMWELGLAWDLAPGARLKFSAGGSGQGMGVSNGGAGYWRRFAGLGLDVWF